MIVTDVTPNSMHLIGTADNKIFYAGVGESNPILNIVVEDGDITRILVLPKISDSGENLVVLIPDDPGRRDLYKVTSADQYGRFSFRGIAPGSYLVLAWEDAPSGAYRDPDFVRRYEEFGWRVDIEQGRLFQVQPELIPAGP